MWLFQCGSKQQEIPGQGGQKWWLNSNYGIENEDHTTERRFIIMTFVELQNVRAEGGLRNNLVHSTQYK